MTPEMDDAVQLGLDKLSVYYHKMEESDAYGIAMGMLFGRAP